MISRELLVAARLVLENIDDEQALRSNPLLVHLAPHSLAFDRLRAHVLCALESLDPGAPWDAKSERMGRLHTILLRCDLQRVPHKAVVVSLGLSRRQFYRDRRAALLAFGVALTERPPSIVLEPEGNDLRLLYIETLRERCLHDAVWHESMRALEEMKGHPREVELWTVAAEAARFVGDVRKSTWAIGASRRAALESVDASLRRESLLRIAISEIALDWIRANVREARSRIDEAVRSCGDERTMNGRDATLFAILLYYGSFIAMEVGDWNGAAEFLRRTKGSVERSELPHSRALLHRLRGRLILQRDGDVARASVELRDALRIATSYKALPPQAVSAVELGGALMASEPANAIGYIEYGLAIGRDACGYDDFAVLYASAIPHLLRTQTFESVREEITALRTRSSLLRRSDLFMRLAESTVLAASGRYVEAAQETIELARELEAASLLPAAAEAYVLSAEALAREGRMSAARQSLKNADETIATFGIATTRNRAEELAAFVRDGGGKGNGHKGSVGMVRC